MNCLNKSSEFIRTLASVLMISPLQLQSSRSSDKKFLSLLLYNAQLATQKKTYKLKNCQKIHKSKRALKEGSGYFASDSILPLEAI